MVRDPKPKMQDDDGADFGHKLVVVCSALGYVAAFGCLALYAYDFYRLNKEARIHNAAQNGSVVDLTTVRKDEPATDENVGANVVDPTQN